jgi:restriction system protein
MSSRSEIQTYRTKSGLRRYAVDVRHEGLNKYIQLKSDNYAVLEEKMYAKMADWDAMWDRKMERERVAKQKLQKKEKASKRTKDAQANLYVLQNILKSRLRYKNSVNWKSQIVTSDYLVPRPTKPEPLPGSEPHITDDEFKPKFSLIGLVSKTKKAEIQEIAKQKFVLSHKKWKEEQEEAQKKYLQDVEEWEKAKSSYIEDRDKQNAEIEKRVNRLFEKEPKVVMEYFGEVLSKSSYPDYFSREFELDFKADASILIVDYKLPDISKLPTIKEVKYVQSRDEFTESHWPESQINKLYDNVLYQVALRTLYELYSADNLDALALIVFNGYVQSIDPATGQEKTACILSVQESRQDFEEINLSNVEPKACFKKLKGVASSKLYSLTPIAPILNIDREDKRFVSSYAVADGLDETYNLAAMDWEDFEHLVRELFEEEFASSGGEVKVTQASRDGGIDAVAFDPDPIRGGKLVIQAKRYTNTVGVSAVRDLYGTVMNEGAIKGIIVTTTDYGPDAYSFAKDKPLTLLNGNNLLHLLEKHGHKAKIDIKEAKQILADKE